MTQEKDYLDLADRVEAAKGPDRELDYAIGHLLGVNTFAPEDWQCIMPGSKADKQIPAYTSSLDVGIATLLPEGAQHMLDLQQVLRNGEIKAWCRLTVTAQNGWANGEEARAAIPALALTVACLRAHASRVGDRRGEDGVSPHTKQAGTGAG